MLNFLFRLTELKRRDQHCEAPWRCISRNRACCESCFFQPARYPVAKCIAQEQ
jgi:hypothetical protein